MKTLEQFEPSDLLNLRDGNRAYFKGYTALDNKVIVAMEHSCMTNIWLDKSLILGRADKDNAEYKLWAHMLNSSKGDFGKPYYVKIRNGLTGRWEKMMGSLECCVAFCATVTSNHFFDPDKIELKKDYCYAVYGAILKGETNKHWIWFNVREDFEVFLN